MSGGGSGRDQIQKLKANVKARKAVWPHRVGPGENHLAVSLKGRKISLEVSTHSKVNRKIKEKLYPERYCNKKR